MEANRWGREDAPFSHLLPEATTSTGLMEGPALPKPLQFHISLERQTNHGLIFCCSGQHYSGPLSPTEPVLNGFFYGEAERLITEKIKLHYSVKCIKTFPQAPTLSNLLKLPENKGSCHPIWEAVSILQHSRLPRPSLHQSKWWSLYRFPLLIKALQTFRGEQGKDFNLKVMIKSRLVCGTSKSQMRKIQKSVITN